MAKRPRRSARDNNYISFLAIKLKSVCMGFKFMTFSAGNGHEIKTYFAFLDLGVGRSVR